MGANLIILIYKQVRETTENDVRGYTGESSPLVQARRYIGYSIYEFESGNVYTVASIYNIITSPVSMRGARIDNLYIDNNLKVKVSFNEISRLSEFFSCLHNATINNINE